MLEKIDYLRRGELIEKACWTMAAVSVFGGVICAAKFGKTVSRTLWGLDESPDAALVIAWIAAGLASAIMWLALSGIGTILRRLGAADGAEALGATMPRSLATEAQASTEAGIRKKEERESIVVLGAVLTFLGLLAVGALVQRMG
ncbi:hypothetical protein ABFG95_12030 [Achromobacter sp. HNDS-1]|uniref:Uncharacterized protein n=1 Tax=Achromobacter sp. HNDS-1 TaxID=3151598 RepID=A0AAU7LH50_9BURK